MKYCSKCGTELIENNPICPNCGNDLSSVQTPVIQLDTRRGLLKFIFLSIITLGIYGIVVMSKVSRDINTIASKYDGKSTMHYPHGLIRMFFENGFGVVPKGATPLPFNKGLRTF